MNCTAYVHVLVAAVALLWPASGLAAEEASDQEGQAAVAADTAVVVSEDKEGKAEVRLAPGEAIVVGGVSKAGSASRGKVIAVDVGNWKGVGTYKKVQGLTVYRKDGEKMVVVPGEAVFNTAKVLVEQAGKDKPRICVSMTPVIGDEAPYWIGVACQRAQAALRAQLGLAEGEGLVVQNVVSDSPAAKAEVQRYDVLIRADEKSLEKPEDLIEIVKKTTDQKQLRLLLVRQGRKQTVTVKPVKRLSQKVFTTIIVDPKDAKKIEEWTKRFVLHGLKLKPMEGKKVELEIVRPGVVLGEDVFFKYGLPEQPEKKPEEFRAITQQLDEITEQLQELRETVKRLESQKQ
jgi:membrane-associated protease RseP (regulator of RpoE activity)